MPDWWPFKKKTEKAVRMQDIRAAEAALRQQVAQQAAAGQSRQAIVKQLAAEMATLESQPPTPESRARLYALDKVYAEQHAALGENLQAGQALEMAGRVEEAIPFYETAVADQIASRLPYEHLRSIYLRRQQPDDARRICQAALDNPFLDEKNQAHFRTWVEKLSI